MTQAAPAPAIATHSSNWQNIISAPLEEDLAPLFLTNITPFLDEHLLPSPKHVQLLLYFALHPIQDTIAHEPLSLLYKLLSLHTPSSFSHCLPTIPTSANGKDHPRWLNWESYSRIEEETVRLMKSCRKDGVWGLLWVKENGKKRKEREDGDDGEGARQRVVSEKGWEVLEWLVAVWEKDKEGGPKDQAYSPLFLQQLPQPYASSNLQLDDASLPLGIICSASQDTGAIPAEEARRRRNVTSRLLVLLIGAALPASPPFLPSSLILALLNLTRALPFPALTLLFPAITPRVPWNVSAHLHTIIIEDLAGTRLAKSEERKRRKRRKIGADPISAEHEEVGDFEDGYGVFAPPTLAYTCEVLTALVSKKDSVKGERSGKMKLAKLSLLSLMLANRPLKDPTWAEAVRKGGEGWKGRVEKSLDDPGGMDAEEAKSVEGIRRAVLALVGMIDTMC